MHNAVCVARRYRRAPRVTCNMLPFDADVLRDDWYPWSARRRTAWAPADRGRATVTDDKDADRG